MPVKKTVHDYPNLIHLINSHACVNELTRNSPVDEPFFSLSHYFFLFSWLDWCLRSDKKDFDMTRTAHNSNKNVRANRGTTKKNLNDSVYPKGKKNSRFNVSLFLYIKYYIKEYLNRSTAKLHLKDLFSLFHQNGLQSTIRILKISLFIWHKQSLSNSWIIFL